MVYSLRLKLQVLSALSVLLVGKPLLFVTSCSLEKGKKKGHLDELPCVLLVLIPLIYLSACLPFPSFWA